MCYSRMVFSALHLLLIAPADRVTRAPADASPIYLQGVAVATSMRGPIERIYQQGILRGYVVTSRSSRRIGGRWLDDKQFLR